MTRLPQRQSNPIQGLADSFVPDGSQTVTVDDPWGATSEIDPTTDPGGYSAALQVAAAHRSFGTPSFLGGPGGSTAFGYQGVGEAMQDVAGDKALKTNFSQSGLPTDSGNGIADNPSFWTKDMTGATDPASAAAMMPPSLRGLYQATSKGQFPSNRTANG